MIDAVLPKKHSAKVSHGQAMITMIMNGLCFNCGTMHMVPQFFANKPAERMIGSGICEKDRNDDVLGRCLDALFHVDVYALYQVIAETVVDTLGLKSTAGHLDITSFHVDGTYACPDAEGD